MQHTKSLLAYASSVETEIGVDSNAAQTANVLKDLQSLDFILKCRLYSCTQTICKSRDYLNVCGVIFQIHFKIISDIFGIPSGSLEIDGDIQNWTHEGSGPFVYQYR